ncbi:MAG: ABC transporter ATP-binding protein [Bacteroidia bacterium]
MALQVKKVAYLYDSVSTRKGIETVSFSLKSGEFLSILGRSGSGKSTLLKAVAGLIQLQSGEVFLDEKEIKGPAFSLIPGNKLVKYVAQDFDLKPDYTTRENINHHLDYNYTPEQKTRIVNRLIELFGLKDVENHFPRQLSGGQQQRTAIAGCLAEMPKLLLLDEPFNDLDYHTKTKTIGLLKNACADFGTSVILVTHNYEEAFAMSDKIMVMSKGKIAQKGNTMDVYKNPKNQTVAGLMGDFGLLKVGEKLRQQTLKEPLILRPSNLALVNDNLPFDLSAAVTSCDFMGNFFRCSAKTELGSNLVFHTQNAVKQGEKVYLKLT